MSEPRIVHVVDDDEAVRVSALLLLERAGYEVREYASGVEFLERLNEEEPGCVLLDIHMPQLTGLEVQQALTDRRIEWPVIVLPGQGDVGIAVQAMKNGAFEFLEKPYANQALLAGIADAFDRLQAGRAESDRVARAKSLVARLTPREVEVMRGLLAGMANKAIGYELDISARTVEVYRAAIMEKLEAQGLSTAVRIAMAAGLDPLEDTDDR